MWGAEASSHVRAVRDLPAPRCGRFGQEAGQRAARRADLVSDRRAGLRLLPAVRLRPAVMKPARTLPLPPPLAEPMEGAGPRLPWQLVVGLLSLATVAAVVVGNGNPAVALAPCILALLLWGVWVLPLRVPMLALLVLSWTLEITGDAFANGKVQTPWHALGSLLFAKLNLSIPVDALMFCGLARGGTFRWALWQLNRHLYLPLVVLLMSEALRGAPDAMTVGKIVLGAGVFRAAEALILRQMFPSKDVLPHATTHHDSVLFATCLAILLAIILERPTRRTLKICALLLPVYLGGMIANSRRLVWTEVAMVALFFFLITPMGRVKRFLVRSMVLSLLPLIIYVAAGWHSQGGNLFGPVRIFRSLFDANVDASTRWRDWENYDLVVTFKRNPLFGSGFGHPYVEEIKLPDITSTYELEPYIPHNSVLGQIGR